MVTPVGSTGGSSLTLNGPRTAVPDTLTSRGATASMPNPIFDDGFGGFRPPGTTYASACSTRSTGHSMQAAAAAAGPAQHMQQQQLHDLRGLVQRMQQQLQHLEDEVQQLRGQRAADKLHMEGQDLTIDALRKTVADLQAENRGMHADLGTLYEALTAPERSLGQAATAPTELAASEAAPSAPQEAAEHMAPSTAAERTALREQPWQQPKRKHTRRATHVPAPPAQQPAPPPPDTELVLRVPAGQGQVLDAEAEALAALRQVAPDTDGAAEVRLQSVRLAYSGSEHHTLMLRVRTPEAEQRLRDLLRLGLARSRLQNGRAMWVALPMAVYRAQRSMKQQLRVRYGGAIQQANADGKRVRMRPGSGGTMVLMIDGKQVGSVEPLATDKPPASTASV